MTLAMDPGKRRRAPRGKVLRLTPEHALRRAAKHFLSEPADRCSKCGNAFIGREPAFIHCRTCGKLARIANASLAAQEVFELRSGLRLAS